MSSVERRREHNRRGYAERKEVEERRQRLGQGRLKGRVGKPYHQREKTEYSHPPERTYKRSFFSTIEEMDGITPSSYTVARENEASPERCRRFFGINDPWKKEAPRGFFWN